MTPIQGMTKHYGLVSTRLPRTVTVTSGSEDDPPAPRRRSRMSSPATRPRRLFTRVSTVTVVLAVVATLFAFSGTANAQASCFGRAATIVARPGQVTVGTSGNDVIVGTSGADEIRGRGGDDLVCAGGGNDVVHGGRGRDTVDLGAGHDTGRGGPGADHVMGGPGDDTLRGGKLADTLDGGAGRDQCRGGAGSDHLASCNEPALATAEAPPAPAPSVPGLSSTEVLVADLVNGLRAQHGVGPLRVSVALSDVARDWSNELTNGFRHNPRVGDQIPDGWWSWGENIAYNGSARAAFDALVDSPGHFQNMVGSHFTHIGVGIHVEGSRVYVTQVFATY